MNIIRHLPRTVAALAFTAVATSAMVIDGARNAGAPASAISAAPAPASAAVFVGIGVGRYPRWRWDGGYRTWRPYGFYYGRPGYVGAYFAGYAPPTYAPYWWHPPVYAAYGYRPYGYHPYWHPYRVYRPYYRGYRRW